MTLPGKQAAVIFLGVYWIDQSYFGLIMLHLIKIILWNVSTDAAWVYIATTTAFW